jgi:hypothetical protein
MDGLKSNTTLRRLALRCSTFSGLIRRCALLFMSKAIDFAHNCLRTFSCTTDSLGQLNPIQVGDFQRRNHVLLNIAGAVKAALDTSDRWSDVGDAKEGIDGEVCPIYLSRCHEGLPNRMYWKSSPQMKSEADNATTRRTRSGSDSASLAMRLKQSPQHLRQLLLPLQTHESVLEWIKWRSYYTIATAMYGGVIM